MHRKRIYSGYASAGNRRMYVRVPDELTKRETNGSPTVLVHGLARSSRSLRPLIRALGDRDVYAPDLPGFGMSDEPHILALEELSDQLRHWMLANGLHSVALIACSSGCQVAIDIAARYPTLVDRLVLIGPTLAPENHRRATLTWRWLRASARSSPTRVPGFFRDLIDAGPGRTVKSVRSALAAPLDQELGLIEAPTLILRGSHDPFVSEESADRLAEAIPHARVAVVPHAGHGAFAAAGKLAPLLRDFLMAPAGSLADAEAETTSFAAVEANGASANGNVNGDAGRRARARARARAKQRAAADGARLTDIPAKKGGAAARKS